MKKRKTFLRYVMAIFLALLVGFLLYWVTPTCSEVLPSTPPGGYQGGHYVK